MKWTIFLGLLGCFPWFATVSAVATPARRPNVILILTDDQGYGDLGFHGNPKIKTPNLDRLARQSVQMQYFYVSPVCSPTRASLMTGRYNYRTGVVDTFLGRSMMHPDEVTLPMMLAPVGYHTAIFGKWHLGDNYPMRPQDKGFQECLVLKGGGIGQPSDPPGGSSYFDPVLQHNGEEIKTKGYCSDVYTDAAIQFITRQRDNPFLVYLAFNCPHTPLQVPEQYLQPYQKMNLAPSEFPAVGHPIAGKTPADTIARIYGMVTNIDDNLGRLFAKLDELKLAEDTLILFLSDNGLQQPRYNAGLRGTKGGVYEGGFRVPCFIRWPGKLEAGRKVDRIAAHIDLTPTILDACGVAKPERVKFDGKSLLPLLKGEKVDWPDRTLYFQYHRGDEPQLYRACAARSQRYKLVQPLGTRATKMPAKPTFELYDMASDPLEMHDVAGRHPDVVAAMKKGYEAWFQDVSGTRGFAPPRIVLGALQENPSVLTRQDWRGPRAGWGPNGLGYWEVEVARDGAYAVTLRFAAAPKDEKLHFELGGVKADLAVRKGATECATGLLKLNHGPGRLEAWLERDGEKVGVQYVEVKRQTGSD